MHNGTPKPQIALLINLELGILQTVKDRGQRIIGIHIGFVIAPVMEPTPVGLQAVAGAVGVRRGEFRDVAGESSEVSVLLVFTGKPFYKRKICLYTVV